MVLGTQLFQDVLRNITAQAPLIILDDHFLPKTLCQFSWVKNTYFLSTRIELIRALPNHFSSQALCNDFAIPADWPIDAVYMRVPKIKSQGQYLIDQLLQRQTVVRLFIVGHQKEGLNSLVKYAEKQFQCQAILTSLGKGWRLVVLETAPAISQEQIVNNTVSAYQQWHWQAEEAFFSKPGVYGYTKADIGSALLAQTLVTYWQTNRPVAKQILDLGCGYGYLTLRLLPQYQAFIKDVHWVATDNHFTAILAMQKNTLHHGLAVEIILDDVGATLPAASMDLIICNPPFHQGFETSPALTQHFMAAAQRLLKPGGDVWWVMNRFLAVEELWQNYFAKAEIMALNGQFKVIRCMAYC